MIQPVRQQYRTETKNDITKLHKLWLILLSDFEQWNMFKSKTKDRDKTNIYFHFVSSIMNLLTLFFKKCATKSNFFIIPSYTTWTYDWYQSVHRESVSKSMMGNEHHMAKKKVIIKVKYVCNFSYSK
jgi:hypothetical protein